MLRALRDDLREWRPTSRPLGALDAVRAAWTTIVGVETARHTAPTEVQNDTLVVFTRSGAWSQQLGFLETQLLAQIAAIDAARAIVKLRFRVGKLHGFTKSTLISTPVQTPSRGRSRAPFEAASTLEELRARMRRHVASALLAAGPRCARCRGRIGTERFCAPCRSAMTDERLGALLTLLGEMPWLDDVQLAGMLGRIDARESRRARDMLATRWHAQLERLRRRKVFERGEPERATAVAYVMLQATVPPDRLTDAIVRHVLGPQLDTLLYPR